MQNDELISKAALKKEIQDVVLTVADTPLSNDYTSKLIMKMGELFRKKIDDAPGVDAEPVRPGRWIPTKIRKSFGTLNGFKCSLCDKGRMNRENYCPNCGALMDGGAKDETD